MTRRAFTPLLVRACRGMAAGSRANRPHLPHSRKTSLRSSTAPASGVIDRAASPRWRWSPIRTPGRGPRRSSSRWARARCRPGAPIRGTARFKNDRSLSEAEIRTIAAWADHGAPKGNERRPARGAGLPRTGRTVNPTSSSTCRSSSSPGGRTSQRHRFLREGAVHGRRVRQGARDSSRRPGVGASRGRLCRRQDSGGRHLVNGRIISADGKPMSRRDIARANGRQSGRGENDKLLSFVPGRGYEESNSARDSASRPARTSTSTCTISRPAWR